MMLKNSTVLLFLLLLPGWLYAQDRLVYTDGSERMVFIQEITADSIGFLDVGENNPLIRVAKSEIHKITFENGVEEYFSSSTVGKDYYYNHESQKYDETRPGLRNPSDRIYLMDGSYIECEVVEKKRFGVNFIPLASKSNEIQYLSNTKINKIVYADGRKEYISGSEEMEKSGAEKKSPKDFSFLSPHFISVSLGPTIPFGIYSANSGLGGYAGIGMDFNIDATYYIFRGFGFSLLAGGLFNNYNDGQLRTSIAGQHPTGNISINEWWHSYITVGTGYYNDFGRVKIDYKALLGVMFSFFPEASVEYMDGTDQMRTVYSRAASPSFAFGGSTGIRYYITRKWSVRGSLTMLFARPNFGLMIERNYRNGQFESEEGSSISGGIQNEYPMSLLNFAVGVAYTIGK